jgi:hypothetical protein
MPALEIIGLQLIQIEYPSRTEGLYEHPFAESRTGAVNIDG